MSDEIPGWKRTQGWHPRLVLSVGGPPAQVLDVVAGCLDRSRFTIKDRDAGSFRARYVDWFAVASGSLDFTRLAVGAATSGAATTLTVDVESGQEHRAGRRNATKGLSTAVAELRGRGLPVTIAPWTYPES